MSEKIFAATPHKRQEARKKGQVLHSKEFVSAIMLLGFVLLMKVWAAPMITKMSQIVRYTYMQPTDWTIRSVSQMMQNMLFMGVQVVAPFFGVGVAIAIAVNYFQVKSLFTIEPLKPQLSRISPLSGAKRMFGVKAWVELGKAVFKVLVIGYFLYANIRDNMEVFPALQNLDVRQGAILLGNMLQTMAWKIALAFLVIALIDYLYQWWDYEKNLRMSHQDLKDEYKQTEGNPQLKAEIKKKQRAMSMRRMMQDVAKADVVITNPTHFAVALRYQLLEKPAPYVVAKGRDEVALRIREKAKEHNITIVENKPLARVLYSKMEVGQMVPAEFYKAVAEVLAFVYRLKKKRPA
ncbi:MAG: flagellar biosynthesis protein FlhB [Peptococcaceae bacterium]|jgi:flagellar biosynthetic protein FlhB|nr:flagellar biosynthesis protein FlhB [Peptococcaceae bacterium]